MPRRNLQLTLTDSDFIVTPLPDQTALSCTSPRCHQLASHRLVIASGPIANGVELLCDRHTLGWADEQGIRITTARVA